MADHFAQRYTQANLAESARPYSTELFSQWRENIQNADHSLNTELVPAILSAMLCAQRRGDAVGPLFHDIVNGKSKEGVGQVFSVFREAIMLALPFEGLPQCMPAVFGLVGELRQHGTEDVPVNPRTSFSEVDYLEKGRETNAKIYHGVGNKEVGQMANQYFPELGYWGNTAIFGYLLGGSTMFTLKEVEIVVASAIIASGATRQARSHGKAALQLGNSVQTVQAVVEVAKEMSEWSGSSFPELIDVHALKTELEENLAKEA